MVKLNIAFYFLFKLKIEIKDKTKLKIFSMVSFILYSFMDCFEFFNFNRYTTAEINKKTFRVVANERPRFSLVLTHSLNHKFLGVRELLDAFPNISEGIFALKAFEIDGVMVKEYETLRVLTKVS